jgi:MFS family permease
MSEAQEWRQGWRSVAATGFGMATGISLYAYLTSLFLGPYNAAFGWTRGDVAGAAYFTLAGGLLTPFLGRLADRFGVRPVIVFCTLGFAAVCFGMANQTGSLPVYYGLVFLLVAFGMGTASVTWARIVSVAFERARGLALSVALSFIAVTAMVMPPALQGVIDAYGWRAAWLALGALCVVGAVVGLALAPRKERVREHTMGVRSLAQAARMPAFWLAVLGMFLINIPSGGVMNQMAALIGDKGFAPADAAQVMSAFALSVIAGRFLAGFCLDRFPASIVAFVALALPAAGCILLMDGAGAQVWIVALGIILAGMSQGAEGDIGPYIMAQRFGFSAFGGMVGAISAATAAGTACGTLLFGRTVTATGSYDTALWIGVGCFLAGALCYLALGFRSSARSSG